MTGREVRWQIDGQDIICEIHLAQGQGTFSFSGNSLPFRVLGSAQIEIDGKRHRFYASRTRADSVSVWIDGHTYHLRRSAAANSDTTGESHATSSEVRALMPGKLLRLTVEVGDVVQERQQVGVMESMKMESPLLAPKSGRVAEIRFKPGDAIDMSEVLMRIDDDQA
jgi:biotin carboxyl carrier protein